MFKKPCCSRRTEKHARETFGVKQAYGGVIVTGAPLFAVQLPAGTWWLCAVPASKSSNRCGSLVRVIDKALRAKGRWVDKRRGPWSFLKGAMSGDLSETRQILKKFHFIFWAVWAADKDLAGPLHTGIVLVPYQPAPRGRFPLEATAKWVGKMVF